MVSAAGYKQTLAGLNTTSALPQKADVADDSLQSLLVTQSGLLGRDQSSPIPLHNELGQETKVPVIMCADRRGRIHAAVFPQPSTE